MLFTKLWEFVKKALGLSQPTTPTRDRMWPQTEDELLAGIREEMLDETTRLSEVEYMRVYQGTFRPEANHWDGGE